MTATTAARIRFCPLCGARLALRDDHGTRRPTCGACGFVYYRNPAPAAGVLLHDRGRVLLVKRRYDPRAGAWCLPAGFMEYGETPRHCALRELREETGLRGKLDELFGVYAGFDDPRVRAVLVLYVARPAGGRLVPGDDAIQARWFPIARPPRPLAFAAHAQALEEFAERMRAAGALAPVARPPRSQRPAAAARNGVAPARTPARRETRRPRPARAARSRSTRA